MTGVRGIVWGLAPLIALGGGVVQADVTGVFDTPDGSMTLEVRDADNLRLRVPDGVFFLVSGGEPYLLGRDNGNWVVIPAAEMPAGGSPETARFEATGEQETVAGIRGEVYAMEVGDSWAGDWESAGEVVFSDDPRVQRLGQGYLAFMRHFGETGEVEDAIGAVEGVDLNQYGILRINQDLVLTSIDTSDLADQNFQLPPDARMMSGPGGDADADGAEDSASSEPGWFHRQLQGTGEDARDDAAGETRGEVRERVRDGVRSFFD